MTSNSIKDEPAVYAIRLQGHLSKEWEGWFEDITITLEDDGYTTLTGMISDQAALHGILRKVRDIGIPLVDLYHLNDKPDHTAP